VRDDRLYARGVSDDKGPLLIPLLVIARLLKEEGELPVNVKFIIEGEEETGSPDLAPFVAANKQLLAADWVVSADGAMWRADLPTLTVASRGLCALEFSVKGAGKDLHSGRHGGSAPNALHALAKLVASLHDADGRVAVAGFYDGILPPDPLIFQSIRAAQFDPSAYYEAIGAEPPEPLPDAETLLRRQWLEPTLEINGMWGGYSKPGSKTVIPASGHAKITCRLVAGQDPAKVTAAIERHLQNNLPPGFALEVTDMGHGSRAFSLNPDNPLLTIAEDVLEALWGTRPLRVAMGATIPIGSIFREHLGIDTMFFSFSTADEDFHAPNEFFRLSRFRDGQLAWEDLLRRIGGLPGF
jgi:acetylornithine deacetylase/succinyl-diaminopimelate desuccinylase-like protein